MCQKLAFTIVLNGMPFIKKQFDIIPKIFDKWYIIEGPAKPIKDTSWCKNIPQKYLNDVNLSNDGTYEYLNDIKNDKIVVIRPKIENNKYLFWDGKVDMCNSFMDQVEDSILMQFDVDEFWGEGILKEVLEFSDMNFDKIDGMFFECNYYYGKDIMVDVSNGYESCWYDWVRLWNIKRKTRFNSHEPPIIHSLSRFVSKKFTCANGWIFDHYAYMLEKQVQFKEDFYGYKDAVKCWQDLQNVKEFPVKLKEYIPWIKIDSMACKTAVVEL